jgi:hypothetical protein
LLLIYIRPFDTVFKKTVENSLKDSILVKSYGPFAKSEHSATFPVTHDISFLAKKAQQGHELIGNRCLPPLVVMEDSMIFN